jgi:hypothetical protein
LAQHDTLCKSAARHHPIEAIRAGVIRAILPWEPAGNTKLKIRLAHFLEFCLALTPHLEEELARWVKSEPRE